MYCTYCNFENNPENKFCESCGKPLRVTVESVPQTESTPDIQDAERLFAKMKSYIGPAILVFFLYLLFYIPGLIANYIYRKEAKRMEYIAGQKLPGTGCLGFMFWLNVLNIPLFVLTLIVLLVYAIVRTIYKQFTSIVTIIEFVKTIALVSLPVLVYYFLETAWTIYRWIYIWPADGSVWSNNPMRSYMSTPDESIAKFTAFGIIAVLIWVLGSWKNGWLKASWNTVKKISTSFVESLSTVWDFVSAAYRDPEPAAQPAPSPLPQ